MILDSKEKIEFYRTKMQELVSFFFFSCFVFIFFRFFYHVCHLSGFIHTAIVPAVSYFILGFQVLYKSRCDNRLNEITERASSDKREVLIKI